MTLLLDENLSRRIVPFIQDKYPGSTQVALIGLEQEKDKLIRQYAIDKFIVPTLCVGTQLLTLQRRFTSGRWSVWVCIPTLSVRTMKRLTKGGSGICCQLPNLSSSL